MGNNSFDRLTAKSLISSGISLSMHRSAISLTASATSKANVLISDSGSSGLNTNSLPPPELTYFSVAIFNCVPASVTVPASSTLTPAFPLFKICQYKLYASRTAFSTIAV